MSAIEKTTSSPGYFKGRSYQIIKEWITSILCKPNPETEDKKKRQFSNLFHNASII